MDDVGEIPSLPSLSVTTVGSLKVKSRAAIRRARATASTFDPPGDPGQSPEAFRAKVEALRADMGDGWLKVLNQSHLGSPGVASG